MQSILPKISNLQSLFVGRTTVLFRTDFIAQCNLMCAKMKELCTIYVDCIAIRETPSVPVVADKNNGILSGRFELAQIFPQNQAGPDTIFKQHFIAHIKLNNIDSPVSLYRRQYFHRQPPAFKLISSLDRHIKPVAAITHAKG
jgi:hypothetical protein